MMIKEIDTGGITHLEALAGSGGWYWGSDYTSGDLYEAEELFRSGHRIRCNRLIFVHSPEGRVEEPVPPADGQYFGRPVWDQEAIVFLLADFPAGELRLLRFDPGEGRVSPLLTLPLSAVEDCYNLMPHVSPLTLTRQTAERFQIIWPEKADFPIHPAESFCFREGERLYFSRWYEDPDYREEVVVRRVPDGAVLEQFRGTLDLMPDGQQWLLAGEAPEPREAQLRRIGRYEAMMNEAALLLKAGDRTPGEVAALTERMAALEAYYGSDEWKRDFADDEAGLLPRDLRRGVLSEDGLYDLLEEYREYRTDLGMRETDRRIVDAVLQKAEKLCPGALELLGVYGSAVTGDAWEKSDVDLLIVASDEAGRLLKDCFILEDTGVGYDLYLSSWEALEEDAACAHAHLAKLMDARLVYCRDGETAARLEGLRDQARGILSSPARFGPAERLLRLAKQEYAEVCLTEDLSQARNHAGEAVYWLLDALMLYHGRYFRLGTKRTFQELRALELPFDPEQGVMKVLGARTAEGVRLALRELLIAVQASLPLPGERETPSPGSLAGTWEEMVSNWKNKMTEASERGDVFSSFMNLGSLQLMLRELAEKYAIEEQAFMDRFDPEDLRANVRTFDDALARYAGEYLKLGLPIRRFADLDAFLAEYVNGEGR